MKTFLLIVCLLTASGFCTQTPLAVHDSLGVVVDAQENSRLKLFGDIPGFSAARFYRVSEKNIKLHVIRNTDSTAQLVILSLEDSRYRQLEISVAHRMARNTLSKDAAPLFTIDEKKWSSNPTKQVFLHEGSVLVGCLNAAKLDTIYFTTTSGLPVTVPDSYIANIESVYSKTVAGQFYRLDPNTSRLFFSPTGRNLRAGQGYFADYFVFFPTLAYGITDYFSLSGGMSLLPMAEEQLFYVAPKLTIPVSKSLSMGTGVLYMGIPEETDDISLAFGVATMSQQSYALTAGFGVPFAEQSGGAILLLGGELQTSNHTKLISENWIFLGADAMSLFSGGIRFFGDNMAVDLALLTTSVAFEEGGFPFIPWVDFSIFFGRQY